MPRCGSSEPWRGARLADGTMVAPEALLSPEAIGREVGARVYVAEVTLGTPTTRRDAHGRAWRVYESRIRFCDRDETPLPEPPSPCGVADDEVDHERTAYAYVAATATDDEVEATAERLARWGRATGSVWRL